MMDLSVFKVLDNIENTEFIEFLNTLHYTFLLDIDKDWFCIDVSAPEWIDTLFSKIEDSIQNLYHSKSTNYFLGAPSYDDNGNCTNTGDSSFFQLIHNIDEMWRDNIKYHVVVSALYTLESSLSANEYITGYELANKYEGRGFLQRLFGSEMAANTDDPSNRGNMICSQIDTLKNRFSSEEIIDFIGYGNDDSIHRRVRELHSDIVWKLTQCRVYNKANKKTDEEVYDKKYSSNMFITLHKKLSNPDKIVYANQVGIKDFVQTIELIDKVQDRLYDFDFIHSDKYQRADHIIYLYKLERFYNLSATRTLFEAIYHHNEKFKNAEDKIDGYSTTKVLLDILKLPNVFSREIFIKYLFESFENSFVENFFDNDMDSSNTFGRITADSSSVRQVNRRHTWERLTRCFCNYFNNLVFPMIEGLFVASIMLSFDFKSPDSLKSCLEDLADYLDDHFDQILNPKYRGGVDSNIICRNKFSPKPDIPNNFQSRDIGLSMFTDSSTFDKKKLSDYRKTLNFLLSDQSNIIHLDSNYRKTISRNSINIWPTERGLYHKQLSDFYIKEASWRNQT